MVIDVTIKIPNADANDMGYVHKAARRLSYMTTSKNVEIIESTMFKPLDDGDGGDGWPTYSVKAACSNQEFDESEIRAIHRMLVSKVPVPDAVAIETKAPDKNLHLMG